jgi:hypothetical protein
VIVQWSAMALVMAHRRAATLAAEPSTPTTMPF